MHAARCTPGCAVQQRPRWWPSLLWLLLLSLLFAMHTARRPSTGGPPRRPRQRLSLLFWPLIRSGQRAPTEYTVGHGRAEG
jgi:hypothetical protein